MGELVEAALKKMQPGILYSRSELLEMLGIGGGAWKAVVDTLVESGRVTRRGEKRGTRYFLAATETASVDGGEGVRISDRAKQILVVLSENPEASRAALLEETKLSVSEWNRAILELVDAELVVRVGDRKGARYHVNAAARQQVDFVVSTTEAHAARKSEGVSPRASQKKQKGLATPAGQAVSPPGEAGGGAPAAEDVAPQAVKVAPASEPESKAPRREPVSATTPSVVVRRSPSQPQGLRAVVAPTPGALEVDERDGGALRTGTARGPAAGAVSGPAASVRGAVRPPSQPQGLAAVSPSGVARPSDGVATGASPSDGGGQRWRGGDDGVAARPGSRVPASPPGGLRRVERPGEPLRAESLGGSSGAAEGGPPSLRRKAVVVAPRTAGKGGDRAGGRMGPGAVKPSVTVSFASVPPPASSGATGRVPTLASVFPDKPVTPGGEEVKKAPAVTEALPAKRLAPGAGSAALAPVPILAGRRPSKTESLPIFAFRASQAGRFDVDFEGLRKVLRVSSSVPIVGLLSTRRLSPDFWMAVAALANSQGGVVLLGVRRRHSGSFFVKGIRHPGPVMRAVVEDFEDREVISAEPFDERAVKLIKICKRNVIRVDVAARAAGAKPIYVRDDAFSRRPRAGTFVCREGQVHKCSVEETKALWAAWAAPFVPDWDQVGTCCAVTEVSAAVALGGEERGSGQGSTQQGRLFGGEGDDGAETPALKARLRRLAPPPLAGAMRERLAEIAEPARRHPRLATTRLHEIIIELCRLASIDIEQLGELLSRRPVTILERYVEPLLRSGKIHVDEHDRFFAC